MIFRFSEKLYEDLNSALGAIKLEEKQLLKRLEQSTLICVKYFTRLRDFFKENQPREKVEQIRFFKEIKPKFKSMLIFHQRILDIESRRPIAEQAHLTDYYLDELKMLTRYFERNLDFYQYIRSGADYLDDQYFIPGAFNVYLSPDISLVDGDGSFTTSHDTKLAHMMANELILVYLEKTILKLNDREEMDLSTFIEEEMVIWTQTNTALTEMIYGWKETKALNHGKLSVARITAYMEKVFHVEIGNISDTWNYISGRSNRTIYLDEMKKAVIERMTLKLR